MLSHAYIGTNDFAHALRFYTRVMSVLGLPLKFSDPEKRWAAWKPSAADRPLFIIGRPNNGEEAHAGNGQMVAPLAPSRAAVDRCHAAALAEGGSCEGPPGLRPQYHANYYGAYFRDLDGNKLCVCCHSA